MAIHRTGAGANLDASFPSAITLGSLNDATAYTSGSVITQLDYKIDGNGAQTDNLFQIVGGVVLLGLYGHIKTVTDSTAFSNVSFRFYDSTAASSITAQVNASGTLAGSYLIKDGTSGIALNHLLADQRRVDNPNDPSAVSVFSPVVLVAKAGASNYVRIEFTGDANTDIDIDFYARYYLLDSSSSITAV